MTQNVKLSAKARNELRRLIRNHRDMYDIIEDYSLINKATKTQLLEWSNALNIDVYQLVNAIDRPSKANFSQMPDEKLTDKEQVEAVLGSVKCDHAFSGIIPFDITLEMLGQKFVRKAYIKYQYTPDGDEWTFFDVDSGQDIKGLEGSVIAIYYFDESSVVDIKLDRFGRNSSVEGKLKWKQSYDLFEDGFLPDVLLEKIDKMIDEDARRLDVENREMAEERNV